MNARKALRPAAACVAVALVVSGWLVWRHTARYHEHISAARGAFPAPLGNGAPDAPDRVVRQVPNSYGVDGALSIDAASDGVVARNMRTGKDYWRYDREGAELGRVGVASDADSVATWWKDGVVVSTDVRTGKPRWHAKVPYGDPDGSSEQEFASVGLIDGLLVTESRDEMTAFAADGGELRWHAAIPAGCELDSGGVFSVSAAVVARAHCTGKDDDALLLLAFDVRRGTLRWRVTNGIDQLIRADDHTLVTSAWTELRRGAVVDVSGSAPAVRTIPLPDDDPARAAGAGIMLCEASSGQSRDGMLEAIGIADGQPQWTQHSAKGTEFGQPLIADGRVYVVQQPSLSESGTSGAQEPTLMVLDAQTGRQLHAMPLPAVPPESVSQDLGSATELSPRQAGDGVLVIGRGGGILSSPTGDLLVVSE